jgi:hypothetical protein
MNTYVVNGPPTEGFEGADEAKALLNPLRKIFLA